MNSTNSQHYVYIIDDDDAVRDALHELLASVGIPARGFASADAFLEAFKPEISGCIVLDIRMPGLSGLDLQKKLRDMNCSLPVIFITGHGDVPMAVQAMKLGAVEFLQKPFRDQELLDCIQATLDKVRETSTHESEIRTVNASLECLTGREKQILEMVVEGKTNKVIAIDLDISQRTVENHRSSILEKMQVKTTPALINLVLSARQKTP